MTYWPAVCDALEAVFKTAAPANTPVWQGQRRNETKDYVVVGWDAEVDAGSFSFERSRIGNDLLIETGDIRCAVVCQTGARTADNVRARAFALVSALMAAVAADQTFGGVLPTGSTSSCSVEVVTNSGSQGVAQRLDLIVTYTTPF